jgi:putative transposase
VSVVASLLHSLRFLVRSRVALHLEIVALRHQLVVTNRSRRPRLRLTALDRVLWAWLSHRWRGWRSALHAVQPATVLAWHRHGFRLFWTWKSRHRTGRPAVSPDVRALIREMSTANPLWGAPRIHGELLKLGISVSESTVAKYMRRYPRPPSQTWRTFLTNHASQIMAADLFVVPTVTFRLLFVLVILAHDRQQIVHVAVTAHPTAAWTAQQLRNAFPECEAPRYLLHDRDSVFAHVATTLDGMNIQEVRTAPRSPWQNAYVERVIGSIRRECLDHVIVVNAAGLHRVLTDYIAYYMPSRTHLALDKDTPITRPVSKPSTGRIVTTPEVGGLHHRYDRIAA